MSPDRSIALRRIDECALDPSVDVATVVAFASQALGLEVGARTPSTGLVVAGQGQDEGVICHRQLDAGLEVWVTARGIDVTDLDDVVARIATVVLVAASRARQHDAPADVRLLIDAATSEAERAAALRRLGIGAVDDLTVLALHGDAADIAEVLRRVRSTARHVHHAVHGRVDVVVATRLGDVESLVLPVGVRCGYAPACSPSGVVDAYRHSVNALRFAVPSHRTDAPAASTVAVPAARLGVYEILAEQLSPEHLASIPDVQRLEELCRHAGSDILTTLLAVASHDSLRQAARVVHLHHNSVSHRVERAEKVLGYSCTQPFGRSRLLLTLTLHRLLASHALF